jgi:signal transduction histidine kinase/ActR/RegA family two-component response regulator
VWERGWRGNVILFIPVYRITGPLKSIEARRRALVGFVFGPFATEQLLRNIASSTSSSVAVDVYDGAVMALPSLLSRSEAPVGPDSYETIDHVRVAGRQWLLTMRAVGEPPTLMPLAAQQTLFGGVVLSFLLFLVTAAQVRAWETAARHESELRASADALRESEAQAQAANRAKDVFLATVSHELRTPLNVVLGWVNMLRNGTVRDERRAEALEIIERNARHQAELIDDLLDVSRIVTGKLRVQLRPLVVAPVVDAVVESLRPSADAKGVALTIAPPNGSPTIRGDADRLHQIAWNLLSNAIKFTPAGGRVSIELTEDPQHVILTVRDTGIGIAPDFLPHVFDRFRQADSSPTRMHGGVGLGLAIVRDLVELQGGTVEARSDGKDLGAMFVVRFPAAHGTGLVVTAPLRDSTAAPAKQLDGIRVLLVDDDPGTRDLLTEALLSSGARVMATDSARSALAYLNAEGADVIVSDIAMPDEDGYWLMHRVRALPGQAARTPAIALTALARTEDRTRAIESGFQLHLAKPVPLGELQASLAALVAETQPARSAR